MQMALCGAWFAGPNLSAGWTSGRFDQPLPSYRDASIGLFTLVLGR